jgi:glutamate-1-semialdehyde 2,1-aminomutase
MTAAADAAINHALAIDAILSLAKAEYAHRNPRSRALFEIAQRSMPGGNTRTVLHYDPFPLYMESSQGARVRDVDEHEYLDILGEYSAGLYGHCDPVVQAAVLEASAGGASHGAPGGHEICMAELLCARFPSIELVRFCNSGTEANLYALTLARIATGRTKLLCFFGAYHGGVFSFAGGGNPMNAPFEWLVCRYNDAEGAAARIQSLGQELAAVIVEPMMSNGGSIPALPEFLRVLRQQTAAVGALLIFDEVVTSRMGSGGMQKLHGVSPDLTTLGKYLGAGFSFGAFGGRSDVMELMNPGRSKALQHAGTFNNNVFSLKAGLAALREVFTPARADDFLTTGESLRARLNSIARSRGLSVQFTGCGSVMSIHFSENEIKSPEDLQHEPKELLALFQLDLMKRGLYIGRRGQIILSLPMGLRDLDLIAGAIGAFLDERGVLIRRCMGEGPTKGIS